MTKALRQTCTLLEEPGGISFSEMLALRVGVGPAVLASLLAQLQKDGTLWEGRRWVRASVNELADYLMAFSEDTVYRYLCDLRKAGVIRSEHRPAGDGRRVLWHTVIVDIEQPQSGAKPQRWVRTQRIRTHALRQEVAKNRSAIFAALVERDGCHCQRCGAEDRLQIDHVTPLAKGGNNDLDNLQLLCATCNARKGAT